MLARRQKKTQTQLTITKSDNDSCSDT